MLDTLERLSREHEDLRALLAPIESAADARDATALAASLEAARAMLTAELDAHIVTEEAMVFTPTAARLGEDLVTVFYEEHTEIRATRDEVFARLDRGEAPYGPSLRLCELILNHQQREDLMLFPSARDALDI